MAKLKDAERYDELNQRQKQIVDLRAKYPNLPKSHIPRYVEGIDDDSTYQYQVIKEHDHIIEERRDHFKETGEYDESVTELAIESEEEEQDELDRLAEEAEEPGKVSKESGNFRFEGSPLDARSEGFQGIQDRPVTDKDRLFACTCGAMFSRYHELQEHLEGCSGEIEKTPTISLELDFPSILEILSDADLNRGVKEKIISRLTNLNSSEE